MATMDILLNQTNRLLLEIQGYLQHIAYEDADKARVNENEIITRLEQTSNNCEKLQIQVAKLPAAQRQSSKYRVDQVIYDYQHIKAGYNHYLQDKEAKERSAREREELLAQDYKANNDTAISIDHSMVHNRSLMNANRHMDDIIDSGSNIMSNMTEQKNILKNARKKILDIGNTLGLSMTVMRLIDKRAAQDYRIFIGGIIICCGIMYVVIKYLT